MRRARLAVALAVLAMLVLPAVAMAHPLGNFTINHYAGLRVEPNRVLLDVVIDQAEIPAFQARQTLDANEDGEVSDAELEAGRLPSCEALTPNLHLAVAGSTIDPELTAAGIELRPGVGGLSTLRLVCVFEAGLGAPVSSETQLEFADTSYAGRLGWREIVVEGSGVAVTPVEGELRDSTLSDRLQSYPADRLDRALADERVVVAVSPGGAELPPVAIPDATPVEARPAIPASAEDPQPVAAVPGGVGGEIPALFQTPDLTPFVLLLSLATAAALGAAHALTPGHGKSLMAAYLVGTRGTPVHAIGLGLSVSASHTIGILVLAALIVGAQGVLNPDLVVRSAPLVAAAGILAIGAWMLISELRRRRAARNAAGRDHDHVQLHEIAEHHDEHGEPHSHGGVPHTHLPAKGSTVTWRGLFVLGLAGGLIPSTSALLILLGAIAGGRPAFGVVLVVAFGLGMAAVMTGVGLALILARGRLDGLGADSLLGRIRAWLPLAAACLVLGIGLYLTVQAVAAPPTF
jgi:ABC-type nickel/cobalt efflux system permease component RcnA